MTFTNWQAEREDIRARKMEEVRLCEDEPNGTLYIKRKCNNKKVRAPEMIKEPH